MTCFLCPRPATTTVLSDYDGETLHVCDPCKRFYVGDFGPEEDAPTGGHIMDGYADEYSWPVWE